MSVICEISISPMTQSKFKQSKVDKKNKKCYALCQISVLLTIFTDSIALLLIIMPVVP